MSLYKEIVQQSTINTSTSKQMYSFGHQNRFHSSQKNLNDMFYEIPTTKTMRSTGFGYGQKFDFELQGKKKNVPAPNHYNLKSDFTPTGEKGKTFSLSREQIINNSILQFANKNNPGPGTYPNKSTLSDLKYSMRPMTNDGFLSKINKFAPGPGKYEKLDSVSKDGKFCTSKFKTYGIPVIHPDTNKKDVYSQNKNPGAGTYNPKNNFIDKVLTKHNTNSGFSFNRLTRDQKLHKKFLTPGPGTYRAKSEFGYYEKTTQQLKQSTRL